MQVSYATRWIILQCLPFMGIALIVMLRGCGVTLHKVMPRTFKSTVAMTTQEMYLRILGMLNIIYLQLVTNTFQVFDCIHTQSSGLVMNAEPSVNCSDSDPSYRILKPLAIACIIFYVVGIPFVQGVLLYIGELLFFSLSASPFLYRCLYFVNVSFLLSLARRPETM